MSVKAAVKALAPAFTTGSYYKGEIGTKTLANLKNRFNVLFFYPLNFTFVCPTELLKMSQKAPLLKEKYECDVYGVSVDSVYSHMHYSKLAKDQGGLGGDLSFPLLSDLTGKISEDYGVLNGGISLRGTFIIDKNLIIRHISINDTGVGREVDEIERLVAAFQYADKNGEVCPASWKAGDATMHPSHGSEKTQKYWKDVHAKK